MSGPCGKRVSDPKSWTATYDSSEKDRQSSRDGKVELQLSVCCPYGQYELELDVKSYNDEDDKEQRVAWRIESGRDGVSLGLQSRLIIKPYEVAQDSLHLITRAYDMGVFRKQSEVQDAGRVNVSHRRVGKAYRVDSLYLDISRAKLDVRVVAKSRKPLPTT